MNSNQSGAAVDSLIETKLSFAKKKTIVPVYAILLVLALLYLFPIFWLLLSAFKPNQEILKVPVAFFPSRFTLENIRRVMIEFSFTRYFANSLFVTLTTLCLNVFTSCIIGYVFAKFNFRAKNLIFVFLLGTLMIPFTVTMIPTYQIMIWLDWLDTYTALIVPAILHTFGIFFHRQYIMSIPDDLLDAARIAGAGEYGIFIRIIFPLAKPAMATIGITAFFGIWDALLWPLIIHELRPFTN